MATSNCGRRISAALAAAAALMLAMSAPASAQKVAFVASEAIFDRLPEMKTARTKLAEMQSTWGREIQRQEQEITKLRDEMETNRLLWSAQERRDAEGRLREADLKLSTFRTSKYGPDGEYQKQHDELMNPLYDRVSAAINEEAKAQKYDFVFDKSSRGLPMLYANADYDLTAAVLQRLGVKVDAADLSSEGRSGTTVRNSRGSRDDTSPPLDPNSVLGQEKGTESKP